jgi:hypothetical protein
VESIERYLGVDLVAFRLREAQAERRYSQSSAGTHASGTQPQISTGAEPAEEKREWNADPTAGIILTGTTGVTSNYHIHSVYFTIM